MVLYLDTGNSFSPQRIAHFLGKTNELASAQVKHFITLIVIFMSYFISLSYILPLLLLILMVTDFGLYLFITVQAKDQILQKVMSNILYHSVFDIFGMFNVLHQLEYHLGHQVSIK